MEAIQLTAQGRAPLRRRNGQQRMKWTRTMNAAAIRAYFLATNLETDKSGYRSRITNYWNEEMPHIEVSSQRIADQVKQVTENFYR